MADTVKKASTAKTPRKAAPKTTEPTKAASTKPAPKKAAVKKTTKAKVTPIGVSQEEIAILAHRLWIERGHQHGHHEEDWLRAEELLRGKAS